MTAEGRIMKGIGGFYYVKTADTLVECRARGVFRNQSQTPVVGDYVTIELAADGTGTVCELKPRKNVFVRPPVSNIDVLVLVAAAKNPKPDLTFLDKMTVIAAFQQVDLIICFNKTDLVDSAADFTNLYRDIGYQTVETSVKRGTGIKTLQSYLDGKTTAFAGFSGVGKSSLLGAITGLQLETGSVSKKLSRGRHTTRQVELLEYASNTFLVDTPGFSMLELPDIKKETLQYYFREFEPYIGHCQFRGCSHTAEKGCAVLHALEDGTIPKSRHENYVLFYQTLAERRAW